MQKTYTAAMATATELQTVNLSTLSRFKDPPASGPGTQSNAVGGLELTGYRRLRTVGHGSFGVAVLYERADGSPVVIKQVALSNLTRPERDMAMNEVAVFSQLHHPNIIAYEGSFVRGDHLLIEMEYADGGTLAQVLSERSNGEPLPERFILNILEQITSAICYMHAQSILHRDLKTANVFLNRKGTVKIGDFGISKIMSTKIHAQTVLGTPYYFSPEMCEGKRYDEKSDIWALGCILGEMCCFRKAFSASNLSELVAKIMTAEYIPIPDGYSMSLKHVLHLLLKIEPHARPSANDVLQHWIPMIYRGLGKNDGFQYASADCTLYSGMPRISDHLRDSTTPSTVTMDSQGTIVERSVLYQVKTFGVSTSVTPLQLSPNGKVRLIATRGHHFVAVMQDGNVYTWGEGDKGQLGHNALETWHHYPTRVDAIKQHAILGAAAGNGFTVFWSTLGVVLSCGDNGSGCLGHGNSMSLLLPKRLHKLDGVTIAHVSCGTNHVWALSDSGSCYSWGSSQHGALGLGKRVTFSGEPRRISFPPDMPAIREIHCGPDCSIVITESGTCYGCGSNNANRLGFGPKKPQLGTLQRMTFIRQKIVAVSVAETHSAFLIEGGYVVTLGDNQHGQRGVGNVSVTVQPTIVRGVMSRYIENVKCGTLYTVAATDDNCVMFWGTRMGVPDMEETAIVSPNCDNNQTLNVSTIENNTTSFTNFLTSSYKLETILDPIDILALYSSKDQQAKGIYVRLVGIYPLQHSVLVLVDTTCPLT